MEEMWKDIKGYEGLYQISSLGNVKGKRGKLLKPQKREHGYLGVDLYDKNHKQRRYSIHRLVAIAFIPNPNNYLEVNHINENKTDNTIENLEWVSHKINSNHGTRGKRISLKNKNGKKSKAIAQFTKDGKLLNIYPSMVAIKRIHGYEQSNICKCVQNDKNYNHAYGYKWRYASEITSGENTL